MNRNLHNDFPEVNSYVNEARHCHRRSPYSVSTCRPSRPSEGEHVPHEELLHLQRQERPITSSEEYRRVANLLKTVQEHRSKSAERSSKPLHRPRQPYPSPPKGPSKEDDIEKAVLHPYIVKIRDSDCSMPNCYLMEESLRNDYEIPKLPYYVVPVLYVPKQVVPNAEFSSETIKQCQEKYARYVSKSIKEDCGADDEFKRREEERHKRSNKVPSQDGLLIKVYQEEMLGKGKDTETPKSESCSMGCQTEEPYDYPVRILPHVPPPSAIKSTQTLNVQTNATETQTIMERKKTVSFLPRKQTETKSDSKEEEGENMPKCKEFERCSVCSGMQENTTMDSSGNGATRVPKRRNLENSKLPSWKY